jgi:hypothetical protein
MLETRNLRNARIDYLRTIVRMKNSVRFSERRILE